MHDSVAMRNGQERDPRTHAIIGAAMEVHRILGTGFQEVIFRDALAIEFELRRIPFAAEVPCRVSYKGRQLRGTCRIDFVCFDSVAVEVKARSEIGLAEYAQTISYLASSRLTTALLLNFGGPRLVFRRFIGSTHR